MFDSALEEQLGNDIGQWENNKVVVTLFVSETHKDDLLTLCA